MYDCGLMGTIKEQLKAELVDAMKHGDDIRKTAVRQIETEVGRARSEPGADVSDEDALYRDVISVYLKKTKKAKAEYDSYGDAGAETAKKLAAEIEFLSPWGPTEASESDIETAAKEIIAEVGAAGPKDMGQVMKALMERFGGQVDGRVASPIVKELLGG
ncbi:MAG: GatB/YqeY domain-containing protein [Acidimicrobiia bacterium]|nr:GatB/YqeY domain-containing protein [Acidimicrobiia bacterium]